MELREYLFPLRRWWWLLVLATIVAGASNAYVSLRQPSQYQARTTLMIGRTINIPNPTGNEFFLGEQLASIYADIANRERVRDGTMEALGLSFLPPYLAQAVPNSQLIEIQVTDTDPLRAQSVANELANQVILLSPTESTIDQERQLFIEEQLDALQSLIGDTQSEIQRLQSDLDQLNSAREIQDAQNEIRSLQTNLSTLRSSYSNLLSNTQQGATNTLEVIEPAEMPRRPVNSNRLLSIIIAATIGFSLAAAGAYLLEYLDKSIKTADEVSRILDTEVIGYIPEFDESNGDTPYIIAHPRSAEAEAFRTLRTNLEFAGLGQDIKSLYISSAGAGAGKTALASNLATILSQSNKKVTLIDIDLRRPNVHHYFGIENTNGTRELLTGEITLRELYEEWGDRDLRVIPAGKPHPNPSELLDTNNLDEILSEISSFSDLIVVDGPPFLLTDASILASKVEGILLVVRPGHTHKDALRTMKDQCDRAGGKVLGAALNRIPASRLDYYGDYWYYAETYKSDYFSDDPNDNQRKTVPAPANGKSNFSARIAAMVGVRRKSKAAAYPPSTKTDVKSSNSSGTDKSKTTQPLASQKLALPKAVSVLRWEEGSGKSRKLVLRENDTILIGRDRINDIVLNTRHVSRRHAVITWRNGNFEITDLGSTNGTVVNDTKIGQPTQLLDGDRIRCFDVEMTYSALKPQKQETASTEEDKAS